MNKALKSILSIGMALVLAIGGTGLSASTSFAEGETVMPIQAEVKENILSVNGQGKITLKPDVAYINIGVQTKDKDASKAQTANKEIMNKVIDALKKAGVKADDISTQNYSIYKSYEYNKEVQIEFFSVSNTLKIKVKNLDTIGTLIDVAADAGANNVNSIRFEVEDKTDAYNKALKLAVQDAAGKANAILSLYGKKVGLPSKISESSFGGGLYYENYMADVSAKSVGGTTSISPQDIEVTANVSLEYNY